MRVAAGWWWCCDCGRRRGVDEGGKEKFANILGGRLVGWLVLFMTSTEREGLSENTSDLQGRVL